MARGFPTSAKSLRQAAARRQKWRRQAEARNAAYRASLLEGWYILGFEEVSNVPRKRYWSLKAQDGPFHEKPLVRELDRGRYWYEVPVYLTGYQADQIFSARVMRRGIGMPRYFAKGKWQRIPTVTTTDLPPRNPPRQRGRRQRT